MKFLQERLKKAKENKKGFTLVEIVVVLVIIAILATLMLGALNGYIDKAKEKSVVADCRSVALAADTVLAEHYAANTLTGEGIADKIEDEITELSGVKGFYTVNAEAADGSVTSVVYTSSGITVTYTAETAAIVKGGTAVAKSSVSIK